MDSAVSVSRTTHGPASTTALGERLGRQLRRGDVLLLQGELGAGKTCLTQGIAAGMGCTDAVTSPTFVMVNEYQGRERLFHIDLYRIAGLDELEELGLWDQAALGVLVVEWPERAADALPKATLTIKLSYGEGPDDRDLAFLPNGERGRQIASTIGGS